LEGGGPRGGGLRFDFLERRGNLHIVICGKKRIFTVPGSTGPAAREKESPGCSMWNGEKEKKKEKKKQLMMSKGRKKKKYHMGQPLADQGRRKKGEKKSLIFLWWGGGEGRERHFQYIYTGNQKRRPDLNKGHMKKKSRRKCLPQK